MSPETGAVAAALTTWAAGRSLRYPMVTDPVPVSGGFDTRIYAFDLVEEDGTTPLILRLYPSPDRAEGARAEADTLRRLHGAGFEVPRVFDDGGPESPFGLPFVIMARAGGAPAAAVMVADPNRIPSVVAALAEAQARLHQLPMSIVPSAPGCEVDRRLAEWRTVAPGSDDMSDALARLEHGANIARVPDDAICHFDFHPMNVLVDGDDLCVVDWLGAGAGSRHSDLARSLVLFTWAEALAPAGVIDAVKRWANPTMRESWLAAYRRILPVDDRRLRYWMAFHAFSGWAGLALDRRRQLLGDPRAAAEEPLRRQFALFSARA